MARFLNHSFPGRKALLFVVEQSTALAAATLGAAAAAALAGGAAAHEGMAPLVHLWEAISQGPDAVRVAIGQTSAQVAAAALVLLPEALPWAVGASATSAAALYAADLYDLRRAEADRRGGGRRTLVALLAASVLLALLALPAGVHARAFALGAALAAAAAVVAMRAGLEAVVGEPHRLLFLGAGRRARELAAALQSEAEDRVEIAGFLPLEGASGAVEDPALVAPDGSVVEVARRVGADWIVLAVDDLRTRISAEDLAAARLAGLECFTVPMLTERLLRRIPVEGLRASEIAFSDGFVWTRRRHLAKRCVDVAAAGLGLLLAAPLLLVAAIAIQIDSRGPLFYRQTRIGLHGRPFAVTKLRTMRVDAEAGGGPQWAAENDPRITRVGKILRKTRIDEIPQLFAVIRGDMSLVGPRPERPFFVEQLEKLIPWYAARKAVPPGITGWAQLRYPYGASVEESKAKLEYDLYYVKNGSAFLDVAILFHTVRHVLTGRGAR